MKTTLALVLIAFALSLCNLMGKRGNTNTNSNSRSSGEMAESSPAASPGEEPVKETAAPPTTTQGAPRAGAPGVVTRCESQFSDERSATAKKRAHAAIPSQSSFRWRA